ncbi:SRPBCC family protein [Nocardia implantans]|uniref:SRPBCC family protein n=1 Tax=Nocardia implantans TaxID=3108168 RepID=A0ABU6B4W9_9NOCA|nr:MULTISPECIES: SRPBCC family protein [unclassified Nocardia]MBF6196064.1 SRPBCC family protein [Nocardia beijingensis]MEA3532563.1 SRPBCC family protein [Nocardia sp. CDC192]MEB3514404.1 SRPBCC family protein [Nocardia sp. CDC186]
MAEFEVVRSAVITADPARVHGLINDFRKWVEWSPWEDLDPQLQRSYSGAESGVGARYAWSGNRKAGAGSMEIVGSADREIGVRLEFLKPMKATNMVTFTLDPVETGTEVTWRMTGQQTGLMSVIGRFIPMDKFVGRDFEKGLARMQEAVMAGTA